MVLVIAGCAGPPQQPAKICPGKKTVDEAIATLNSQSRKQTPLKAAGHCLLKYQYQGKQHQENFPVKLWLNPPDEIYLQGDVAFDATGLVLGANSKEFWLWLKPKEISAYWWGGWSQAKNRDGLVLSPDALREAFGLIDTSQGDWSLTHGRYDILWLHNEDGILSKRVYIEKCDYVPAKIEYFDGSGKLVGGAEFTKYRKLAEEDYMPMQIRFFAAAGRGKEDSALITLVSAGPTRLNEQQKKRLFHRPQPLGFTHIYQIIDGNAIEQGQD